jgi:hypothetical protein
MNTTIAVLRRMLISSVRFGGNQQHTMESSIHPQNRQWSEQMSSSVCNTQDVSQFREVAGRLASIIQSSPDRISALNKLVEAVSDPETFTDLILRYAGRWLTETGGQSVLIGPEMFWHLSAPDGRNGALITDNSSGVDGCGERTRKMLLVCVLESLAQTQWHSAGTAEQRTAANNLTDPRPAGNIAGEHTIANNGITDHRFVINGTV